MRTLVTPSAAVADKMEPASKVTVLLMAVSAAKPRASKVAPDFTVVEVEARAAALVIATVPRVTSSAPEPVFVAAKTNVQPSAGANCVVPAKATGKFIVASDCSVVMTPPLKVTETRSALCTPNCAAANSNVPLSLKVAFTRAPAF